PIPSPGAGVPMNKARSTAPLEGGAANFSPFPSTCLSKSLVLWSLLLRSGTDAEIRIGVFKDSDDFAAHAWVEVDGTPVNDTADVVERHEVFADPLTSET
ncbi:MAG: lasso peptide biosynthesis B2 protein, partial [Acidobacteriota bacterium]|nr:lasso peptide biosynthesis B2 protein [Acidobacteriota bacterium]